MKNRCCRCCREASLRYLVAEQNPHYLWFRFVPRMFCLRISHQKFRWSQMNTNEGNCCVMFCQSSTGFMKGRTINLPNHLSKHHRNMCQQWAERPCAAACSKHIHVVERFVLDFASVQNLELQNKQEESCDSLVLFIACTTALVSFHYFRKQITKLKELEKKLLNILGEQRPVAACQ